MPTSKEDLILESMRQLESKVDVLNNKIIRLEERYDQNHESQVKVNDQVAEIVALKQAGIGMKTIAAWLIFFVINIAPWIIKALNN